ncbi:MAG: peptidyl-prolyl cis-trans isomerase [Deltaproteobacteria bacterium]|nr:peptidyl-prolyl cis-trans isomerase [Deltaproteobacteria bacterium]
MKKRLPYLIISFLTALLLLPAAPGAETVDRIVAIINDSVVTLSELEAATALALDRLEGEEKKDAKKIVEIKEHILDSIIEQKLVKQASDKAGIEISEREIDNAVEDVKKQNNMTHEAFLVALARSGLTYRGYREQLKEQIRQVKFINKEFRSRINIQPEEIDDYYRQNRDEFLTPASFRIRIIFISSADKKAMEGRVKAVNDGISGGEDFAGLARQYSGGAEAASGGDLGYVRHGEIDKALEEAALRLKPGGISAPVEKPEGIYIIQLVEKRDGALRPLDEVRGYIQNRLFNKTLDERFKYWLIEIKKAAHVEMRL